MARTAGSIRAVRSSCATFSGRSPPTPPADARRSPTCPGPPAPRCGCWPARSSEGMGFYLLLGVVLLGLGLLAARSFIRANPASLAQGVRAFIAAFSALASTGLLFTGRFGLALITIGATFMAVRAMRRSAVSGLGEFGSRAGCQREDPRSVPLLETYLDRRQPDWRAHVAGEQEGGRGQQASAAGAMDEATACSILGLSPEASADEIKAAHRRLMTKLHPDHGGSSYLAAQLNQAKDLLLSRRR